MQIGVPKEIHPGERRVATTPEAAEALQKLAFTVAIASGPGLQAHLLNALIREDGR